MTPRIQPLRNCWRLCACGSVHASGSRGAGDALVEVVLADAAAGISRRRRLRKRQASVPAVVCRRSSVSRWSVDAVNVQDPMATSLSRTDVSRRPSQGSEVDGHVAVGFGKTVGKRLCAHLDVEARVVLRTRPVSSLRGDRGRGRRTQLPPGAPPHLSDVICIRPYAPPSSPNTSALHDDSCIANAARKIGGTGPTRQARRDGTGDDDGPL